MIDLALTALRDALRGFIQRKLQVVHVEEKVVLTSIVDQDGQSTIPNNSLGIALYRIAEDRITEREHQSSVIAHHYEKLRAPVIVDLEIMIAANFKDYSESLKFISATIAFFQTQNLFDHQSNPDLPESMTPFSVTMFTPDISNHNHTWSLFGGRYMPSAMYRLHYLVIQENQVTGTESPVEAIDLQLQQLSGDPQ